VKWLLLCLPLFGCAPCEEQGGKWVQDGYYYSWLWLDKQKEVGYLQKFPNYICLKEKVGG